MKHLPTALHDQNLDCLTGYNKCSKILNTFLFLFSNKTLVIRAGIHKMLVRIANWADSAA